MKNKFFRCYFCKTKNNYFVPADQNGKECKCCQAFNYFQENSDNNYNNNNYTKNKKGNKFKRFHNKDNKTKRNGFNSNSRFGETQNNFYKKNYNDFSDELNDDIHPKSNIFSHFTNSIINNIPNNNINLNYRGMFYNNFLGNQPSLFSTINNNNLLKYNLNRDNLKPKPRRRNQKFRNNFYYKKNDEEDKKEDIKKGEEEDDDDDESLYHYNEIIKYFWLKKEKMTNKILDKEMNENQCSICLRNIKLNHVICITKCGHVFHYKCIEEVIDHNINACPNCRSNLKTGEKQKNYDKDNTNNNLLNLINLRFPFENNSFSDSVEYDEYESFDDNGDYDIFD